LSSGDRSGGMRHHLRSKLIGFAEFIYFFR
jgi:hypothetical protein